MNILSFTKTIQNFTKLDRDLRSNVNYGSLYNFLTIKGDDLEIHFKQNLNQSQIDAVSAYMATYSDISIFDNLVNYLGKNIDPFVDLLMRDMRAENIEMGITQANKTTEVLGFFEARVLLPNRTREVSLKGSIDTSSLTSTIEILSYYIANPNLYSDLSPFITADRLTVWKNKIITHLSQG